MIKNIEQKDAHSFSIEWNDGLVKEYRLSELQKRCPCAGCVDETTGEQILDPSSVSDDVRASRIVSVGRYAIRIFFTSGCSNGIYSFDFLHAFSY
jgi:DUF971 family protein